MLQGGGAERVTVEGDEHARRVTAWGEEQPQLYRQPLKRQRLARAQPMSTPG
jgi:hypothetical protein